MAVNSYISIEEITMTIKRVDKNCITCRITKAELEERGVALEDLMSDRDKASDLLRDVLAEAQNTVNFRVEGPTLNVQMAVLSDGDINLTIFDDDKSAFAAMLRQYKEILESKREELMKISEEHHTENHEKSGLIAVGGPMSILSPEATRDLLTNVSDDEPVNLPVEVSFADMDRVITLCNMLYSWNGDVDSDLYEYNDRYYLRVTLTETKKTLVRSIFAIAEYCDRVDRYPDGGCKVGEHGKTILAGHAVRTLAQMS